MKHRRLLAVGMLSTLLLGTLAACGSDSKDEATTTTEASGGSGTTAAALPAAELSLVAYSTPQEAYEKIIAAFQKTPAGKNITFSQSYGASGDQSRAVEAGLAADVVAFSLEPDITRLVKANLVAADWNSDEHKGMVTDSVVVIGTRKGNPDKLKDWADLTKDGVEVITPNPFQSGGAKWNILAAYGALSDAGKDDKAGLTYLDSLFKHVPVQDDSGRKSLQTFTGGKGDAILTYENEALFAQAHDQAIDYTIPDSTILIENPVAVTSNSKHPEQAKAFVDFLRSEPAQKIFAAEGYRPVVKTAAKSGQFPTPSKLFTIDDLGGWSTVNTRFFDPEKGIFLDIERALGVPTKK
jgi:sulfate/thiosulfate-binding protein